MSLIDVIKYRKDISEVKEDIIAFLNKIEKKTLSNGTESIEVFLSIEDDKNTVTLAKNDVNKFSQYKKNEYKLTVEDGEGKTKTFFSADIANIEEINTNSEEFTTFIVTFENSTFRFNKLEMFELDNNFNPKFAKFDIKGNERFENSQKLIMEYCGKTVILNYILLEDGFYYVLTEKNSKKMEYIRNGNECEIFNGKSVHFFSKVEVLEDKLDEIFDLLNNTNNNYFDSKDNLVVLRFKEIND